MMSNDAYVPRFQARSLRPWPWGNSRWRGSSPPLPAAWGAGTLVALPDIRGPSADTLGCPGPRQKGWAGLGKEEGLPCLLQEWHFWHPHQVLASLSKKEG